MKNKHNEEVKIINCNLCGNKKTCDYIDLNEFKYVKCLHCGLIYQNPQPLFKPLIKRYQKKYFEYELRNQENFFALMKKTLNDMDFFRTFQKQFKNKKRFLDIGCATGLLLNHIQKTGWDATGIELDPFSVKYAKKNFKVNIINKSLEESKLGKNSFEVVHWSHVIEHLTSPSAGLKKIHDLLVKNGYMLLTTPRVDSFQQFITGKNWRSYHRDHLTIFSKKTLLQMVKKADFKILKMISWGGLGLELGYPHWMKNTADKAVKLFNLGDVMFILAKKI